jgi:hypothetical protein
VDRPVGDVGGLRGEENVGGSAGGSRRLNNVYGSVEEVGGMRNDVGGSVCEFAGSRNDVGVSVGDVSGSQNLHNVGGSVDLVGGLRSADEGDATIQVEDAIIQVDESPFAPVYADEDEEDDVEDPFSQFEIYGLSASTNGRSCHIHSCCGSQVTIGDVVRLKKTVIECDSGAEEAICCILVRRGRETCTIGFVPRPLLGWQPIVDHLNRHAQVVEMYVTSRNTQKRRKNHLNCGVAGCIFLDEINQIE